jgi:sugar/nucleoside kinase (ribokinase family)
VVGDVVTDVVARHRGLPVPGTDTAAAIRTVPGGAGANVACWAAHWGLEDVRLLGRVGAESAAWHERELTACGVRARLVVDPDAPTGTVICLVDTDASGERTFLTDSGASLRLGPGDWSPALLDGVARLHLSGYLLFSATGRALVSVAVAAARARAVPVSLDPASAGFLSVLGTERFLTLVEGVDVLLPSRDEACLLTGLSEPEEAAAVRDTTGAGDAFTGAFLAALLSGAGAGADPVAAAREGCRAGALAVGEVGGRPPGSARAG